jgi:acetylornithine deacetylase
VAGGHPLLGSGSLHASLISGGQELSSYPEHCRLSVERRTVPGETREGVDAEITSLLRTLAEADADFKATYTMGLVRDSFQVGEDEPIVQTLRRRAAAALGHEPVLIGQPFWMDTAILSAAGIPSVAFGSGGAGAHAVVEWVDLDQVQLCADIVLATALAFCA